MSRRPLFSAVFVALLLSEILSAQIVARYGRGTLERVEGVPVLRVAGTPYEMGKQHGVLLRALVRKNIGAILDNKEAIGRRTEYKAYKLMRPLMHMRLRRHVPERFKEEMRGLADGAGLDYDDIEAGNLFPEAFHCSGMALMGSATKDGSLYHVRILDYMTEAGLQDSAAIIIHEPDEGRRWINVGFAGFIGSVTGMNDAQITVGEMGGRGLFRWDGMPMAFLVREVLERSTTLDEAMDIFEETPRTCEYYYVVSDAKIPDARGLWTTGKVFESCRPGETFGLAEVGKPAGGAAGNKVFVGEGRIDEGSYHLGIRSGNGPFELFLARQPKDCVVLSGPDRYRHFVDRLAPRLGSVDERILMDLIKRPVSMAHNLHCAVFHPSTGEVWVAIAAKDGAPACNQTYHRFVLPLLPEAELRKRAVTSESR